jgi:hypothetical protein
MVCRMPPDTGKWRDKRDAGNTHKSPHAEEMLGFLGRRLQVRLTSLLWNKASLVVEAAFSDATVKDWDGDGSRSRYLTEDAEGTRRRT